MEGTKESTIAINYPMYFNRYNKLILKWFQLSYKHIRNTELRTNPNGRMLRIFWFYGDSNAGKTVAAGKSAVAWIDQHRPGKNIGVYSFT